MKPIKKLTNNTLYAFVEKLGTFDGVRKIYCMPNDKGLQVRDKNGVWFDVLYIGATDTHEVDFYCSEVGDDKSTSFFTLEEVLAQGTNEETLFFILNEHISAYNIKMCDQLDINPKWVAFSTDGSYEDESKIAFNGIETCYNNMRRAVLEKMTWNTEWEDFDYVDELGYKFNRNNSISYDVKFLPHIITHKSYSGLYIYMIDYEEPIAKSKANINISLDMQSYCEEEIGMMVCHIKERLEGVIRDIQDMYRTQGEETSEILGFKVED